MTSTTATAALHLDDTVVYNGSIEAARGAVGHIAGGSRGVPFWSPWNGMVTPDLRFDVVLTDGRVLRGVRRASLEVIGRGEPRQLALL